MNNIERDQSQYYKALKEGDFTEATKTFQRLSGYLLEAEIPAVLEKRSEIIIQLRKQLPETELLSETDLDIVAREGTGKLVYYQVKAGKQAVLTKGSDKWKRFKGQAERTAEAAATDNAKVRYIVDDISKEAKQFLMELKKKYNIELEISKTAEIMK